MKKPKIIKLKKGDVSIYVNPSQIRRITITRGGTNSATLRMAGGYTKTLENLSDYAVDRIAQLVRDNYNVVKVYDGGHVSVQDNRKNLTVMSVSVSGVLNHVFPRGLTSVAVEGTELCVRLSDGESLIVRGDNIGSEFEPAKPILALA